MITQQKVKEIELRAEAIRETIVQMLVAAGSGHTAGPLGMADIFAAFYFYILNHDPKNPQWQERDRLMLSNGHIVPVRYAAMAHAGYFPVEECLTLRKFGSRLRIRRAPRRQALPRVLLYVRRRAGRRQYVGSGDVCWSKQTFQPYGNHRPQQYPDKRHDGRRDAAGEPARQIRGVRLARARDRRQQRQRDYQRGSAGKSDL